MRRSCKLASRFRLDRSSALLSIGRRPRRTEPVRTASSRPGDPPDCDPPGSVWRADRPPSRDDPGLLKALLAGWLLLGVGAQYAALRGPRQREDATPRADAGAGIGTSAGQSLATAVPPRPQPAAPRIRPQALTGHAGPIKAMIWDPRDRWWDTQTSELKLRRKSSLLLRDLGKVRQLLIYPDGRYLIHRSEAEEIQVTNVEDGSSSKIRASEYMRPIAITPAGRSIATHNVKDGSLYILDSTTGEILQTTQSRYLPDVHVLFADSEGWIAATCKGYVDVINPTTGALLHRFGGHERWINAIAASPVGCAKPKMPALAGLTRPPHLGTGRRSPRALSLLCWP